VGLTSVASVFSRYVVVGFILPPFFAFLILWKTLSPGFPPDRLHYSEAANVAILGGLSLLAGLLLLGLYQGIVDLFLFNPLENRGPRWMIRLVRRPASTMRRRLTNRRDVLRSDLEAADPARRFDAMRKLDRFFPLPYRGVLTTRLGNVIDAWKGHAISRWGLDYDAVWPRMEAMLTEQERSLHEDARTDVAFFLNSTVVAFLSACAYFGDWIAYRPHLFEVWWIGPAALAYVFYRLTVTSAARLGDRIRASIDIHRLDLYSKLSVLDPTTFEQEQRVAKALNEALLSRVPVPDDCRRPPSSEQKD